MAVLADHKTFGAGFKNDTQLVRVTYDFSVDGGAVADYDVFTSSGDMLVELVSIDCQTALTAATNSVVDLGKGAGGTEFLSDLDAASGISVDVQTPADTAGTVVELADGEKIVMGVEVAAITAGKLVFLFKIYSR